MLNNASRALDASENKVLLMPHRSLEPPLKHRRAKAFHPIHDEDSSIKAMHIKQQVVAICKMQAHSNTFDMIRLALIIGDQKLVLCAVGFGFLLSIPRVIAFRTRRR